MAVRQYVGARYVPKFYQNSQNTLSSEWEGNKAYEALTVVTYNNSSYTSKIPVPAGIGNPASNPTYWVVTGAYNAQVEQYRQEVVKSLEDVNTNLQNTQTKIEGDMQTLKDDTEQSIKQVQEQTNETQSNLTEHITISNNRWNSTLRSIKDRYFVFLGDSYSIGTSGGVGTTNFGWVDQVINMLGLTENQYTKCTANDIGLLPAFWASTSDHRSWVDSIKIIHDRMTTEDANKTTDVVLCGGYNETSSPNKTAEEITGPMQEYITYCKTAFPNATYWLGEIGYNVNNDASGISARTDINSRVIPTYQLGSQYGFRVMSGTEFNLWWTTECTDGIHPNESTYKLISIPIVNNLLGTGTKYWGLGRRAYEANVVTSFTGTDQVIGHDIGLSVLRKSNEYIETQLLGYFEHVYGFTDGKELGTVEMVLPYINGFIFSSGLFQVQYQQQKSIAYARLLLMNNKLIVSAPQIILGDNILPYDDLTVGLIEIKPTIITRSYF